jgi:hypothetical protein
VSPLSPVVTNETTTSSPLENGVGDESVAAEYVPKSKVNHPELLVKSVIGHVIKSEGSPFVAILTCPLIAEVTASIAVKKLLIEPPPSS